MEYKAFDSEVASQMKGVVLLLEHQELALAEESMRILAEEVQAVAPKYVRQRKLDVLKKHLATGLGHIERLAPITALVRLRQGLAAWLAD